MTFSEETAPMRTVLIMGGRPRTGPELAQDAVQWVQHQDFLVMWASDTYIFTFCNLRDDIRLLRFNETEQLPSLEVPVTAEILDEVERDLLPLFIEVDKQRWAGKHVRNLRVLDMNIGLVRNVLGQDVDIVALHDSIRESGLTPEHAAADAAAEKAVLAFMTKHGATEMEQGG